MKKIARLALLVGALGSGAVALGACAYGGVAAVGSNKVVITRNDLLLYGVLRKVYVCEVGEDGELGNCVEGQAP